MMESQSKVNPIIIESLKKVERLFRIKARIVDAINAKIQVKRDKIASLEKVEKEKISRMICSIIDTIFFVTPWSFSITRRRSSSRDVLVLVRLSACNGFGFGRLKIVQMAC